MLTTGVPPGWPWALLSCGAASLRGYTKLWAGGEVSEGACYWNPPDFVGILDKAFDPGRIGCLALSAGKRRTVSLFDAGSAAVADRRLCSLHVRFGWNHWGHDQHLCHISTV